MKELRYILAVLFSSLIIISGVGISVVQYCCAGCETTQSCCTSGCSKCHNAHRASRQTCKDTGCTAVYYKVDFVKLESWFQKLGVNRMAQLHGSVLISLFGFNIDELPFMTSERALAEKLGDQDKRLTLTYLAHYPLSTTHSMLRRLHNAITQIEE